MKKLFILFSFLITYASLLRAQECYPDKTGKYMYYVNLNQEVSKTFDKKMLMELLTNTENANQKELALIKKTVSDVSKSFPTSETEFLQKSVTIYASRNDLSASLEKFKKVFNLVEFICQPKRQLLYEPNDFETNGNTHSSSHLRLTKAKDAWDITIGDERILIGVTDTYMETTHEDLQNKLQQVINNTNGPHYHGIHVSGCAAADTDNGLGVSSVGGHSKIVFSGRWGNDSEVLLIAQIPGVRVINMSWINSCSASTTQQNLYQSILDIHNVVLVGGAGNNNDHCGSNNYVYPASHPSVLSVSSVGHINDRGTVHPTWGATNWKDVHQQDMTNITSTHHHNDRVALTSPGYNVASTGLNNGYHGAWGTSFAAPQVAGVCGLVAAVNPCLTAVEISDIVTSTADPYMYALPENSTFVGLLGSGRLDAYQAVKKALELGQEFVQNKSYTGTATETAETSILCAYDVTNTLPFGLITVHPGSDVTFRGTHKIVLGQGFRVHNNSYFKAEIYDSPCF